MNYPHQLTTHRGPRRLTGARQDPHPCQGQDLGRQRAAQYRRLRYVGIAVNLVAPVAIVLMGAAWVVLMMCW